MTLRQLVSLEGLVSCVPGVRILDRPHYRWRGFMMDSGRAPNSLAQMKRIVRVCSAFKLNFVVFREGDDEVCAVRYDTNRLGSDNPRALSMDEIREFVSYAALHGIAVVPEIESLGHSTAKGRHYPDLVSGGFQHQYTEAITHTRKSHLNPADPRSYELLETIYDEWFPILTSPLVHLGLDEVRLPKEEQAAHFEGLLPVVDRVAKKYGREIQPIVWADAPPTPKEYADKVIRCFWCYGDCEFDVSLDNKYLIIQGIEELSAPGCMQQVFMGAGSGSKHEPYSKTSYDEAFYNLARWATFGKSRPNFTGLLAVQWHGNMLDDWLPDFATAADYGWTPPDEIPDFADQMERVERQLSRLADAADPSSAEVDPHIWDGIWLRDGKFYENIFTELQKAE
jgi:hypothetical protein